MQKRDRLEERHEVWQARAERLGRFIEGIRDWKGKKLPYTMGVMDVACVLAALDYFGLNQYVSVQRLVDLARDWLAG